ncbi:hypothetical protein LLG07_09180 [bacterium]|nr:hypothetical protein [bacterium]
MNLSYKNKIRLVYAFLIFFIFVLTIFGTYACKNEDTAEDSDRPGYDDSRVSVEEVLKNSAGIPSALAA